VSASEFALIDRHFRRPPRHPGVRIGIGDDAAVIAPAPDTELAISVDMLVEGRHFLPGTDASSLGHKTLAVNLSDMAAMGAQPRYALLAGALPDADDGWLGHFMAGFRALADEFDVELIGGDTTRGPRNLCVTIVGELPRGRALARAGAQPGDDVYVSGTLGGAAWALAALRGDIVLAPQSLAQVRARLERPQPRVALGLALRDVASAAIDVSDGLVGDLRHVLRASGCSAALELSRLPAHPVLAEALRGSERTRAVDCLLGGGDDYELCFTAAAAARAAIVDAARATGIACTRVGVVGEGSGLTVLDADHRPLAAIPRAFDHFA
jgi:thiamine-monophosphate kinase